MTRQRGVLAAFSAVLVLGGLVWGSGAPALTLTNGALVAAYPLAGPCGRLVAALGCVLLALLLRGRGRLLASAPAAAFLIVGLHQAFYRIQADSDALELRGLFTHERLPWKDVVRVDRSDTQLDVVGPQDRIVALPVAALQPADRASLERTIARHLREIAHPEPAPATSP
jgi:Bacterial PH domain